MLPYHLGLSQYFGIPTLPSGLPPHSVVVYHVSDFCADLNAMTFFVLPSFIFFFWEATEVYSLSVLGCSSFKL